MNNQDQILNIPKICQEILLKKIFDYIFLAKTCDGFGNVGPSKFFSDSTIILAVDIDP